MDFYTYRGHFRFLTRAQLRFDEAYRKRTQTPNVLLKTWEQKLIFIRAVLTFSGGVFFVVRLQCNYIVTSEAQNEVDFDFVKM